MNTRSGEEIYEASSLADALKELREAYSLHSRVATRAWVTLAGTGLTALVAVEPVATQARIPILDVTVSVRAFCMVTMGMITALTTRWLGAVGTMTRIQWRSKPIRDALRSMGRSVVDPRDLWAFATHPATLTLALPLTLLGSGAFFGMDKSSVPRSRRTVAVLYYVLLKCVGIAVHYGIPLYAVRDLFRIWPNWGEEKLSETAIVGLGACAAIQLVHGTVLELGHMVKSAGRGLGVLT